MLLARWGTLMVEAVHGVGLEAVAAVLHYLLTIRKIEDSRVLLALAREHGGIEREEIAMNAVDRVKAEGRAEGKPRERPSCSFASSACASASSRRSSFERVRGATADDLDAMADRILTATTAADVVG